jgi:hypothetical protein
MQTNNLNDLLATFLASSPTDQAKATAAFQVQLDGSPELQEAFFALAASLYHENEELLAASEAPSATHRAPSVNLEPSTPYSIANPPLRSSYELLAADDPSALSAAQIDDILKTFDHNVLATNARSSIMSTMQKELDSDFLAEVLTDEGLEAYWQEALADAPPLHHVPEVTLDELHAIMDQEGLGHLKTYPADPYTKAWKPVFDPAAVSLLV